MLQTVDVLPARRRALRRSVHVPCEVIALDWGKQVRHFATDLSPYGCWLDTPFPLQPETEVVVAFTPPRWGKQHEVVAFARICRRVRSGSRRGMGLEFLDASKPDVAAMFRSLRGLPPPFVSERRKTTKQQIWVDTLLTWDDGEHVKAFTISELLGMIADDDFEFSPLGSLLASPLAA